MSAKQYKTSRPQKSAEDIFIERNYGLVLPKKQGLEESEKLFRAELLLRQEQQFSEALIQSSVDGIAACDRDLNLTVWNLSMEYITGLPKQEVLGRNILKILPNLKGQLNFPKVFNEGRAIVKEMSYVVRRTGRRSFFDVHVSPLFGKEGEIIGALAIIHDQTHRKEFEEKLEREVKDRTAELSQVNESLTREIDNHLADLKRIQFDNTLLKLLGKYFNRQEYLTAVVRLIHYWMKTGCVGIRIKDQYDFIPYEAYVGFSREFWQSENLLSLQTAECACIRVIKGQLDRQDKKMATKSGSFYCPNSLEFIKTLNKEKQKRYRGVCMKMGYASLAIVPIRHEGKIIGAIHLADRRPNMVPQEKIELLESLTPLIALGITKFGYKDQLVATNDILEKFFTNTYYLAAYMDKDFNFIRVNPAYAQADEHTPNYYLGKNHFDLFPNVENEAIFIRVVETGKPYTFYAKPFQYIHNPERGTSYWDWTLYPIKNGKGEVQNLLLVMMDVTERTRATERLIEAYKHIGLLNRRLSILFDVNKKYRELSKRDILKFILESAQTLVRAKVVAFYSLNGKNFELVGALGTKKAVKGGLKNLAAEKNDILRPILDGKKVFLSSEKSDLLDFFDRILIFPIESDDKIKGMFLFGGTRQQNFSDQDIDFAEALVHQVIPILDNLKIIVS